jgi:hypothetical protein
VLACQLGAMLHIHRQAHAVSQVREARVGAAARGSVVVLPPLGFGRSPWFVGDDLRKPAWRDRLADRYRLADVVLGR